MNQDGQPNTVFVLHQQDPALIQANHSLGAPTLDSNPRRLGVLLSSPQGLPPAATSDELLLP